MKNSESKAIIPIEYIEGVIYFIRGQKVMLDKDLAILYGTETKKLIQAVKRNIERFPEDFMFQLNKEEYSVSRFQIGTLNTNSSRSQTVTLNTDSSGSQIATLKRGQNIKYLPYAFTEQGVAMLSSVLHSPQAVKVNIEIMRAFIKLRQVLTSHKELAKKLQEVKEFVLKNSLKTDCEFIRVWRVIEKLTTPIDKDQRKIGFDLN